ncbi:MAG: PadR family transcriptional regulator [Lachnospiraceae bacterium]|nr:PadR family transcriptional regulator [Lachnospiraceae bacterium]
MLKHGILGLLNYGDMSGYEIMAVFRDSLSHFWTAQKSQIYRELQVLEKNGWIEISHIEQDGKPDKNMLSITDEGRKELLRWLREETPNSLIRSPLLMKTFFRGECGIDENIAYFKTLLEEGTVFPHGSKSVDIASSNYASMIEDPQKSLYWIFTIRFGMMYEKMFREWCEDCIRELNELQRGKSAD